MYGVADPVGYNCNVLPPNKKESTALKYDLW